AGAGALTIPLARAGARVIAIECDPVWVRRLTQRVARLGLEGEVRVRAGDLRDVDLPAQPFRVVSSPPFHLTTTVLRRLLDDPARGPYRVDLVVQWEVARKRAELPPRSLLSTAWAPWWEFELVRRIPRGAFRPTPGVDAAWLAIRKRRQPLLPPSLARDYAEFVRSRWPL
ncbi:MAG TPA: rRNA adenine N-6-methyltransferase family protein, partial [Actinomycetota bacterium]|nr:rRNA adenine N-6-methyltransferase family protein [Actinomycetota bacterium]